MRETRWNRQDIHTSTTLKPLGVDEGGVDGGVMFFPTYLPPSTTPLQQRPDSQHIGTLKPVGDPPQYICAGSQVACVRKGEEEL